MRSKVSALSAPYILIGACVSIVLFEGYHRFRPAQEETKSVHADLADPRIEISIEAVRSGQMMVALAFEQTGSSNSGKSPTNGQMFNFFNGKPYPTEGHQVPNLLTGLINPMFLSDAEIRIRVVMALPENT